MTRAVFVRAVLAVVLLCAGRANAGYIYSQPASSGANTTVSGPAAPAFDNFTLGSSQTITQVDWQGTVNGTAFNINFYADNGSNAPGNLLYSYAVGAGSFTATPVNLPGNVTEDQFAAVLATPFTASGNTEYWISITGTATSDGAGWGWQQGTGGDGLSYVAGRDGLSPVSYDEAFTLESNVSSIVPAPPGFVLASVAAVTFAAYFAWRRKSIAAG